MDHAKTFWQEARQRSLEPGGFGKDRVHYWSKLLHVNDNVDLQIDIENLPMHADEQQIRLDTDRSFVMYPDGDVQGHQESLNKLLVSLFRSHPSLSYFQGYHDVITVLFLTLPPPLRFPCAEKVSLHWTRDAMGDGLEPVLGLLRFLAKLIAAVDADLAKLLKRVAPLPYFALSNILTMFAHNIPTLPLIQHVFDYLLARPPIALVYLTAAVILARRDELLALDEDEDGDIGMLHSLLGALPPMSDGPIPGEVSAEAEAIKVEISMGLSPDLSLSVPDVDDDTDKSFSDSGVVDETDTETITGSESYQDTETVLDIDADPEPLKPLDPALLPTPLPDELLPSLSSPEPSPLPASASQFLPLSSPSHFKESSSRPPSSSLSASQSSLHTLDITVPARDTSFSSSSLEAQPHLDATKEAKKLSIPLSTLLRDADKLLEAYPPYEDYSNKIHNTLSFSASLPSPPEMSTSLSSSSSHSPDLSIAHVLSFIMGPLSVVYTWSEDPAQLPSDTDAESMVRDTSKVVYPWDPSQDEDGEDAEEVEEENAGDIMKRRRGFRDSRVLRRPEFILSAGAGAVLVIAIALAMFDNRGIRGERLSLEKLLGLLGIWGTWGWNWLSR